MSKDPLAPITVPCGPLKTPRTWYHRSRDPRQFEAIRAVVSRDEFSYALVADDEGPFARDVAPYTGPFCFLYRTKSDELVIVRISKTGQILREVRTSREPLPKEVRERLVWSWNYGIAESMRDDTLRHNAQWIASGIKRGEDATDEELILQFVQDGRLIDLEWTADDELSRQIIELFKQPWVVALIEKEAKDNA